MDCYTFKLKNSPVDSDETVCGEDTLQQLLALSREISWLIGNKFSFKGLQWLRSQYQHQLAEQGFVNILPSKTVKFNDQKFVNAVLDFYGKEYWDFVKPGLHKQAAPYFAHCLFACDMAPVIDRVTHISLIRFLSSSLKEFFKE